MQEGLLMMYWRICSRYQCDDVSDIPLLVCILPFVSSPQNRIPSGSVSVNISKLAFDSVSRFVKQLMELVRFENKINPP